MGTWQRWDIKRLEPKNMKTTERAEAAKTMLEAAALNKESKIKLLQVLTIKSQNSVLELYHMHSCTSD